MSSKTQSTRSDIIAALTTDSVVDGNSQDKAFRKIAQVCSKTLKVDEVSFWQFTRTSDTLVRITHETKPKSPTKSKQVPSVRIKDYIKAVQERLFLMIVDTSLDERTTELCREFLNKDIKATLHIPMHVNGMLVGVAQFNQLKTIRTWDLDDILFACQATDLAVETMKNSGMKLESKYIPDIIELLNGTLDDTLLTLHLTDGMLRLDEIPIVQGFTPEAEMSFTNEYHNSGTWNNQTIVVHDVHNTMNRSQSQNDLLKGMGIRSYIAAPFVINQDHIGHILVSSTKPVNWKNAEIDLVKRNARHLLNVVEDGWMRQDEVNLSGLIQRFRSGSQSLNRMMMFDDAIQAIGRNATEVLETDVAFIVLRNPDNTITCPWTRGLDTGLVNGIVARENGTIQSILRDSKTPVLFPDISKSILPKSLHSILAGKKIQSARIFPLVYEDQTLGAVVGFYKNARMYTRNERSVLTLFANSAALTLQNGWMYNQIEKGYLNLALALANTVDARETTLKDISTTSAKLAEETARALKVPDNEVETIHWAAMLHDIGKNDVPGEILTKSGPLNEDEWRQIRRTPEAAEKMLAPAPNLRDVSKIIRNFHEHYDGRGYPDGLKGDQIPMGAKVLAVSDAYTSMTDRRPYREPRTPENALKEIQHNSGTQFDPVVVKAFSTVVMTTLVN